MPDTRNIRYATDLVTFYNPAYWGGSGDLDAIGDLFAWGEWTPETFWNRVMDDVKDAGLDGIELTFAPGNYRSALDAFGSAEAFAGAVAERGLAVASGFLSSRDPDSGHALSFTNADDHGRLTELVEEYAAFLGHIYR